MSTKFTCTIFNSYNPITGSFTSKKDCIPWDVETMGYINDPLFDTLQECYDNTTCSQGSDEVKNYQYTDASPTPPTPPLPICDPAISISNVELDIVNNQVQYFDISLTETAHNGILFYNLVDQDNNYIFTNGKGPLGFMHLFCCRDEIDATDNYSPTGGGLVLEGAQLYYTGSTPYKPVCAIDFILKQFPCGCPEPPHRDKVPVEDSGGPGTAGAHWENNNRDCDYPLADGIYYPGIADIMIGWLSNYGVSNISRQFLYESGYAETPGLIFDRCSWANIESAVFDDLPGLLDSAATVWESLASYEEMAFNNIADSPTMEQLLSSKNIGSGGGGGGGGTGGGGSGDGGDPGSGSGWEGGSGGSGVSGSGGSGCQGFNGIRLNMYFEYDDGPGWIAAASVVDYVPLGGVQFSVISFNLYVNSYYANYPYASWLKAMIHELGHGMGIGILWTLSPNEQWLSENNYPRTVEAYNAIANAQFCSGITEDQCAQGTLMVSYTSEEEKIRCGCCSHKLVLPKPNPVYL